MPLPPDETKVVPPDIFADIFGVSQGQIANMPPHPATKRQAVDPTAQPLPLTPDLLKALDEQLYGAITKPMAEAGYPNLGAGAAAIPSALADLLTPQQYGDIMMPMGGPKKGGKVIDLFSGRELDPGKVLKTPPQVKNMLEDLGVTKSKKPRYMPDGDVLDRYWDEETAEYVMEIEPGRFIDEYKMQKELEKRMPADYRNKFEDYHGGDPDILNEALHDYRKIEHDVVRDDLASVSGKKQSTLKQLKKLKTQRATDPGIVPERQTRLEARLKEYTKEIAEHKKLLDKLEKD